MNVDTIKKETIVLPNGKNATAIFPSRNFFGLHLYSNLTGPVYYQKLCIDFSRDCFGR